MNRIQKVQEILKKNNTSHVLISDPLSIYYLIQKKFYPHERFLGLLIPQTGTPKLYLNILFPCSTIEGVETVSFCDTDDYLALVAKELNGNWEVDKSLCSRFLLPLMEKNNCVKISSIVEDLRMVKDEEEIEKMRKSSALNDEIMGRVEAYLHPGIEDRDVEKYIYSLYEEYHVVPSFDPIVAFKKTASDPHASANGQVLEESDVCIIDMGVILDDYCSDMTRSFVYHNEELEKIYEIVKEANEAAEKMIHPGVRFCDIDKAARDVIEKAGYGMYFTHRTGHGIGLECHEPKDVSSTNEECVSEGNIFSIEPGIYLPGIGGIRIEDLVLVTHDGVEVLNRYRK